MPALQTRDRLRGVLEAENLGDRNLELRLVDRTVETIEFATSGRSVVGRDTNAATFPWLRFDTIRVGHAAALSQRVEAARQLLATNERQYGIDPFGSKALGRPDDVVAPSVDDDMRAQAAHELDAVGPRRGGE